MQSERGDGINHSIIAHEVEFEVPRIERCGEPQRPDKVSHGSIAFHKYIFYIWSLSGYGPRHRPRRERELERAPLERTSLYLYRICMHLCACMYCVCICKRENVRRHTKCSRTGLQTMHPGAVPRNSTDAGRALTNFFLPSSSSRYGCKAHAAVKVLCPPRRLWIRGLSSQSKVVSVFFRHNLAHY